MGSLFIPNRSAATKTRTRTGDQVLPQSGMCVVCLDGCPGFCEIGTSAMRGPETIYPQPFGEITAGAQKDYPVDFSHFNITGTIASHHQKEYELFTNVNLEARMGRDGGLKLRLPLICTGLGSTQIAYKHFENIGNGAAICGTGVVLGENVIGMDDKSKLDKNGKVTESPELIRRFKSFKDYQKDGYGFIAIQANPEDLRFGALEYSLDKLGADAVELKWGQGAKNIGGEVKIFNLDKALRLKKRGYIVIPDPEDKLTQESFKKGTIEGFERHTRIGAISEYLPKAMEDFVKAVEHLRSAGAKYIFLKTGAYRPSDLARAIKFCSIAKVDVLTVDGAGGGTGMSPWRMMNEWGVPTLYISAMIYEYCDRLAKKGEYVPDIVLAGGLTSEDHIFKAFALCAPYVKAVGMSRSTICAVHVGNNNGKWIKEGKIPKPASEHGDTVDKIFYYSAKVKKEFGSKIGPGALGMYSYYQRLATGLRQIMAGARRFSIYDIVRDDIFALTREAADVTGINYIMDWEKESSISILDA
ncbi:MAG: FMN-binding glutamate synthase family protein [Candidatus Scalinduaceae bacterium]